MFCAATSSGVSQPAQMTNFRQSRLIHGISGFIASLKFLEAFLIKITEAVILTTAMMSEDTKIMLVIIFLFS